MKIECRGCKASKTVSAKVASSAMGVIAKATGFEWIPSGCGDSPWFCGVCFKKLANLMAEVTAIVGELYVNVATLSGMIKQRMTKEKS